MTAYLDKQEPCRKRREGVGELAGGIESLTERIWKLAEGWEFAGEGTRNLAEGAGKGLEACLEKTGEVKICGN